jgi:hypothetical protein
LQGLYCFGGGHFAREHWRFVKLRDGDRDDDQDDGYYDEQLNEGQSAAHGTSCLIDGSRRRAASTLLLWWLADEFAECRNERFDAGFQLLVGGARLVGQLGDARF